MFGQLTSTISFSVLEFLQCWVLNARFLAKNHYIQYTFWILRICEGGSVEGRLYKKNLHSTANLNFIFLSLFASRWKNCSSQCFSNWKSAKSVFCSKKLSSQKQTLTLSFGEGKFKFDVSWGLFIEPFFHWDTFTRNQKMSKSDFQSKCLFSKIISRFFQTFMSSSKDLSAAKSISFWWRYASCKLQSHMQFYPFSGITFFSRCF